MIWNNHKELEGKHAFLGASNYHWIGWNDQTFQEHYYNQYATQAGTAIHKLAHDCIVSRIRIGKHDKNLVDMTLYHAYVPLDCCDSSDFLNNLIPFVNDAIGFHMSSEVILYYNPECFGTTDAISFNEIEKVLRIHDLKTGAIPAHVEQLLIYAALFCLEYHKNPTQFVTELRIYQSGQVAIFNPTPEEIEKYMDLIVMRTKTIQAYLEQEGK